MWEENEDEMVRKRNYWRSYLRYRWERRASNNFLCKKITWVGYILRRNSLLDDGIEGQMTEVKGTGRRTELWILMVYTLLLRNQRD
jgi:hypothetical protein